MTDLPVESERTAPQAVSRTQPFLWSVRRELWENRSILIAPVAVASVVLFGFILSAFGLPQRRRAVLLLDPTQQRAAIGMPYDFAAVVLLFTAIVVGIFYCLDALHGERRDRSILFWKSLPVSDRTAVLSKAAIPLVVLPLFTFAVVVATQLLMLLWTSALLLMNRMNPASTLTHFNPFLQSLMLLYGLMAIALWHAPMYGWLLLISAWARRAMFLWAVLPLFAIAILERIVFNSAYFAGMMRYRLIGFAGEAFVLNPGGHISSLTELTPGRFLTAPGLWIGLVVAALFLAAAVRLRRLRDPI